MAESACRMVELDEGSEAEHIESNEYIFDKIGASVSLAPGDSQFDPSALPSQPLVVSERLQLLLVAHSDGFLVARTKDVIDSAKETKEKGSGPSLKELCVVNILIGKVHILALSRDSETVAASVGGDIHFFLVNSLLNKDQTPHYSCSLGESEYVKDMKWTIRIEKSYIVLSNNGKLYHGVVGGCLQHVLDNVDAVEWSVNQSLIALARKNVLTILSHDFKETLSMSLCFDSLIDGADDANDDYSVKVDSVRWDRPDCIILGCLQVTADGTEENYLVQAISVKRGRFTDALSEPIVSSFNELFTGIIDDIVPCGTGPYLFLSYIKQRELGIIANKKNTDQHINLIGWSSGDSASEVAVIDFNRDKWAPRVPLQDNDDDNLVVGLCLDGASLYEKVKFQQGVEDPKELSPYCVIFCLTLEGKLIMFHFASISDTPTVHQGTLFSDEDTTTATLDLRHDHLKADSEAEQPRLKGAILGFQSKEVSKTDQLMLESIECPKTNNLAESKMRPSPILQGNAFGHTDAKSLGAETNEPARQHIHPLLEQNQVTTTKSANLGLPKTEWDKNSLGTDNNLSQGDQGIKGDLKLISSNGMGVEFSNGSSENSFYDPYSLISNKDLKKVTDTGSMAVGKFGISFTDDFPKDPGGGSQLLFPSSNQIHNDANNDLRTDVRDIKGDSVVQHSSFKDASTSTSTFQPTSNIDPSGGPKVSPKIEALPSVRSSQKLFQPQTIPDTRFQSEVGKYATRPLSGKLASEASLSKGSINIKDMTEQLDKLLKGIEETGGFVDSTSGQMNSTEVLRHGLQTLSGECKRWKGIMKESLEEIQDLLNKTVQARKTYMESIVKQSSDTQYWELWDRQRLGSELEMKRRNIIKMHQEMTNQLIQLEMHFNNLELNKFGEKGGANVSHRGFQSRLREPRHVQSLNSLQNTMNSQLVVAEQLSRCLSEQMALLNVESPCPKQQNVKRDLFKTIGLPLDAASSNSPGYTFLEKHSVPSSSASVKNQSRRNQATGSKNHEPETARRRRESLDRSWVVFEPPKTTVKRTMLREGINLDIDKPLSIPRMLEESTSSLQKERRTPSTLYSSRSRALQDNQVVEDSRSSTSMFKWVSNDEGKLQTDGTVSPARTGRHPFSSPSISSLPLFGESSAKATGKVSSERAVVRGRSAIDLNDSKSVLPADTKDGRTILDSLDNTSSMMSGSHVKEKSLDRPTTQGISTMTGKGISTMTGKSMGTQSAPVFVAPKVPVLSGKAVNFNGGSSQSESGIGVFSAALPASSSATSQFSSVSSVSAAPSFFPPSIPKSSSVSDVSLSKTSTVPKSISEASELIFPASTSSTLFSSISSSDSSPFSENSEVPVDPLNAGSRSDRGTVKHQQEKPLPFASMALMKSKSPSESVPPTSNFTPKLEESLPRGATNDISEERKSEFRVIGASLPPTNIFTLKLEDAVVSESKVEVQEERKISEPSGFGGFINGAANAIPKNQVEQPFTTTNGSASMEKTEVSGNAAAEEDEMEEEAPETNPAAELTLGRLDGFGLGSISTQAAAAAAPKKNPFGGSLGNVSAIPASSPFTMSSSGGELFRPASFSFSPPQSQPTSSQQPSNSSFGGFGSGTTPVGFQPAANQTPSGGGFGQPAQVGQGQQALGSVLGSFGQSRQIGIGQPANSFAPASGFGSGFAGSNSAGGFANAATKPGGFAALASNSGGFAAAAASPGGFAGVAAPTAGAGFGGFAGAAGSGVGFGAAGGGGGFGQQGSSFSAFGGTGAQPPAQLFTQMRK